MFRIRRQIQLYESMHGNVTEESANFDPAEERKAHTLVNHYQDGSKQHKIQLNQLSESVNQELNRLKDRYNSANPVTNPTPAPEILFARRNCHLFLEQSIDHFDESEFIGTKNAQSTNIVRATISIS